MASRHRIGRVTYSKTFRFSIRQETSPDFTKISSNFVPGGRKSAPALESPPPRGENLPRKLALRAAIAICECAFLSSGVTADDAPLALRGKSVIVTWREKRVQRQEGDTNFHEVTGDLNLSLYFGDQGHVFVRFTPIVEGKSGPMELRFGDESRFKFALNFSGTSMTFFDPWISGGVRRVTVKFSPHFESCAANAMFGKGDAKIIMRSSITHAKVEVMSVKPGRASCSVRQGNVFEAQ
jgi:hypothetical protein